MVDDFGDLRRFAMLVAVVDAGSFSAAARSLGLTKAALSKQVQILEDNLGVRLLHRTTRRIRATEEGAAVLEHARRMVADAGEARAAVARTTDTPTGLLRVTAPIGLGQRYVAPAFSTFLARHPRLAGELLLDDRPLDIVARGIDIAVRGGALPDSALRRRRLAPLTLVVVGAPRYLASRGEPKKPDDLLEHDWIAYIPLGRPQRVRFTSKNKQRTLRLDGRLAADDGEVVRVWVAGGLGLALLPLFWVERDLLEGRLSVVLRGWEVAGGSIFALHPYEKRAPARVRMFLEHLATASATW